MTKTMAEVIQEAIENTPYWIQGDPGTHQDPYANAAAALSAAGFGLVADAKAEAWDAGFAAGKSRAMRHMSDEPNLPLTATNPYRDPS